MEEFRDINVTVGGPQNEDAAKVYKTVVLKNNLSFEEQVVETDTKYVVKWEYALNNDVTMPADCLLEFDGGKLIGNNHNLVGDDTILIYTQELEDILPDVELTGRWIHRSGAFSVDDSSIEIDDNNQIRVKAGGISRDMLASNSIDSSKLNNDAVDGEDIYLNADNKIQLKDKDYDPEDYSGLGRVYLRKQVGPIGRYFDLIYTESVTVEASTLATRPDGIVFVTASNEFMAMKDSKFYRTWTYGRAVDYTNPGSFAGVFVDGRDFKAYHYTLNGLEETEEYTEGNVLLQRMMNKENTIYHIQYDYDLCGDYIEVPEGCVLEFEGGSLKDGTIIFMNTKIDGNAKIYSAVGEGSSIKGTLCVEWFDNGNTDCTDCMKRIKSVIETSGTTVSFQKNKIYIVKIEEKYLFKLQNNTTILGNGATIKVADNSNTPTFTWDSVFLVDYYKSNITIDSINLDCNGSNNIVQYSDTSLNLCNNALLVCRSAEGYTKKNVVINNCSVKNSKGVRAIYLPYVDNITITHCTFVDIGPVNGEGAVGDHSVIMGTGENWYIANNYISNITVHKQGTGLDLGCYNSIIENNYVCSCMVSMNLAAYSTHACENNIVSGNKFVGHDKFGIMLWCMNGTLSNNIIENNIIQYNAYTGGQGVVRGIDADYGMKGSSNLIEGLIIRGNTFKSILPDKYNNSYEAAIGITGNDKDVEFRNSMICNNYFYNLTGEAVRITCKYSHNIDIFGNVAYDACLNSTNGIITIVPFGTESVAHDIVIRNNVLKTQNSAANYGIYTDKKIYNFSILNNIISCNDPVGLYIRTTGIEKETDERIVKQYIHVEHVTTKKTNGWVNNIQSDQSSYIYDPYSGIRYYGASYTINRWLSTIRNSNQYPNSPILMGNKSVVFSGDPIASGCIGWVVDSNGTYHKFGQVDFPTNS